MLSSTSNTATQHTPNGRGGMMPNASANAAAVSSNGLGITGLSLDAINELMTKGRARGVYPTKLIEWIENSDEAAIEPAEVWKVEFGGKSASALYQSFNSAAKKAGLVGNDNPADDVIALKQFNDHFYMIHKARYLALQEAAEQ